MDIRLQLLTFGKFSTKAIELTNNDKLRVLIDTPLVSKWSYIAILKNETSKFSLRIKDGIFEIPKDFFKNGVLNIVIEARDNGETMRLYQCEPLNIKIIDNKIVIIPEILEMTKKVDELTKLCNQLSGKVETLENQCQKTLEIVMKLNGLTAKVVE